MKVEAFHHGMSPVKNRAKLAKSNMESMSKYISEYSSLSQSALDVNSSLRMQIDPNEN